MRKSLWLMLVLGLVLVLAACGNNEKEPEVENDGVEEQEPAIENGEEETDSALQDDEQENADPAEGDELSEGELAAATVDLIDTDGDSVGTVELTEQDDGVKMKVNATDLPEGEHGFHFHEVGKCEVPDFESAGGHFNPTGASHGVDHEDGPHAGDLPNLEVSADGSVDVELVAEHVTLKSGEENSLMQEGGTALIIHADPDDGVSQPSGDAGDRIVCGVIQ